MKYFQKYLDESTKTSEVDISVHCDIKIFEWLLKYMNFKDKQSDCVFGAKHLQYRKKTDDERLREKEQVDSEQPVLDLKNVISILISSDFLGMELLVRECISYVVSNLHDVVRLPIDMNCLNSNLIAIIAQFTPMHKLNSIVDKRDKLVSKLFLKKLEKMLYISMLN